MTKWLIRRVGGKPRWQLVTFLGPAGGESTGIVDILAVRKDHKTPKPGVNAGDLLEIVLIQVKGGTSAWPSSSDIRRLQRVARHHRAKAVVLAEWQKGKQPLLYRLKRVLKAGFFPRDAWVRVDRSRDPFQ